MDRKEMHSGAPTPTTPYRSSWLEAGAVRSPSKCCDGLVIYMRHETRLECTPVVSHIFSTVAASIGIPWWWQWASVAQTGQDVAGSDDGKGSWGSDLGVEHRVLGLIKPLKVVWLEWKLVWKLRVYENLKQTACLLHKALYGSQNFETIEWREARLLAANMLI